jgi:hypothetical protein
VWGKSKMTDLVEGGRERPGRDNQKSKRANKAYDSHQDLQQKIVKGSAEHERKGKVSVGSFRSDLPKVGCHGVLILPYASHFLPAGKVLCEIVPPKNRALERLFSVAEKTVFGHKSQIKPLVPVEELFSKLSISRKSANGAMKPKSKANDLQNAPPVAMQGNHRTASPVPSQLTQQMMKEEENPQASYVRRCQTESEALLQSCPPQLAEVNQTYLKQLEAFNLADQCNAGLPKAPKVEIKLSKVTEVPERQKLLNMQDDLNETAQYAKSDHNGQKYKIIDIEQNDQAGALQPVPFHEAEATGQLETRLPSPIKFSFDQSQYNSSANGKAKDTAAAAAPKEQTLEVLRRMKEKYHNALKEFASCSDKDDESAPPGPCLREEKNGFQANNVHSNNEDTSTLDLERLPIPRRNDAIHVFCVERENEKSGAYYRTFVATSYASVWRVYLASSPSRLHWYEVIRENSACNLYFDLEYTLIDGLNAHVDGNAMVDTLIGCVQTLMERNWAVSFDPNLHVYELDSSTPTKFSRHLIFKVPGHAFYNNIAAGHFAAQVVEAAGNLIHVDKSKDCNAKVPFVDIAVYTRNRHFRLPFSCKGGKSAVLRPTQRFACTPGSARPSPARIFLNSIICNVPVEAKLLLVQIPNKSSGETLSSILNVEPFSLKSSVPRPVTFGTRHQKPSSTAQTGKEWIAGRYQCRTPGQTSS